MPLAVPASSMSAKQQLVLTAERMFALHGLDGVPLRHIGAAAGMSNKSAVQYHFGSKDGLVDAVLLNRLEQLTRRRELLTARAPADDLRRIVEAHQLPLIELAEDETCFYLPFLEQALWYGSFENPLDHLPAAHRESQDAYVIRIGALIDHVPQPLRDNRIHQISAICVHACADRHRARRFGAAVSSYAVHVSELLDGMAALLAAVPSDETLAALRGPLPIGPSCERCRERPDSRSARRRRRPDAVRPISLTLMSMSVSVWRGKVRIAPGGRTWINVGIDRAMGHRPHRRARSTQRH